MKAERWREIQNSEFRGLVLRCTLVWRCSDWCGGEYWLSGLPRFSERKSRNDGVQEVPRLKEIQNSEFGIQNCESGARRDLPLGKVVTAMIKKRYCKPGVAGWRLKPARRGGEQAQM